MTCALKKYFILTLYEGVQLLSIPMLVFSWLYRSFGRTYPYSHKMLERFGSGISFSENKKLIWIHSVSVGESKIAHGVHESIQKYFPAYAIHLSCTTPTARALHDQFSSNTLNTSVSYLPIDEYCISYQTFKRANPKLYLSVESELWINHFSNLRNLDIPVILINARMSATSFKRWKKFSSLFSMIANQITLICCRGEQDYLYFSMLGMHESKLKITGNLKYDTYEASKVQISKEIAKIQQTRMPWLGASTHDGEELILAQTHVELLKKYPNALLLLAPRHPHRSEAIKQCLERLGLSVCVRSRGENLDSSHAVYLCDTLGELGMWYRISRFAFIGGSMPPHGGGGHNPIEAVIERCPVITGNQIWNFQEEYDLLAKARGCHIVNSPSQLTFAVLSYSASESNLENINHHAFNIVMQQRGSIDKMCHAIAPWLPLK
ncbi:MAG: glycosyltransferase N-terminal domain-containing protein [Methylacidiphilales bacterium]|nr:glycosyltransferase N-terminal domain-containing protein [Candidatus Methylacidiphilales bacterium]